MDQRHLHVAEEAVQVQPLQLGGEALRQPQRHVGVLAGVLRRPVQRHLGEGDLALPLPRHVRVGDGAVVQVLEGERVQVVLAGAGVEQVAGDHGVEGDAPQLDPHAAQHQQVVLEVLPHLLHGGVLQQLP